MGRAGSLALLGLLLLPLLAPLVLGQVLAGVYYLDVQYGTWYAVNTQGQSYRVFYLSGGNTVFVAAYRWDANTDYVIFQAPCTCRVYLRQESYTMSVLETRTWFTFTQSDFPQPSTAPTTGTAVIEFYYGNAAWTVGTSQWTGNVTSVSFSSYTVTSFHYSPDTGVVASATATWSLTRRKSFVYQSTTLPSIGTDRPNLRIRLNSRADAIVSFTVYTEYDGVRYNGHLAYMYLAAQSQYYVRPYGTPSIADAAAGTITSPYTGHGIRMQDAPSSLVNYVSLTVDAYETATTSATKTWQKANNVVTASNGNRIRVYDSLAQLAYAQLIAVSSTYSYHLYTQNVTITFSVARDVSKAVVVPLNTSSMAQSVRNPNPAAFVVDVGAWTPAYIVNYGTDDSYLVVTPPPVANRNSLMMQIVYNYPVRYSAPQLSYIYTRNVLELFAVQGAAYVRDTYIEVYGNVSLGNFLGSTLVLRLAESNYTVYHAEHFTVDSERLVIYVNSTQAYINADPIRVRSALVLYSVLTEHGYGYSVQSVQLKQWSMEKISYVVAGNIVGSWSYRVPIYITLAELPHLLTETGFVFRVELPVGDWVRAGLLSPALEDLMIVDAGSRPLLFYVYRVRGDGRAVVYFRYDAAITSNTLVVYVLLKNAQLWGTGRTFSTAAVFDLVNPREFTDDFGYDVFYTYLTYNAVLVTATDATRFKLGKTWFDFVYIEKSRLVEQHGSAELFNATLPSQLAGDDEVLIYVSRDDYDDVLIFRNAQPLASFRLSEFRSGPAYYVGYSNAREVYAFRMLMYSYTVGQLVGGFQSPPQVVKTPAVAAPQAQVDWWSLFLMIFAVIMVSVAVKWLSEGAGGGERKPLRLP